MIPIDERPATLPAPQYWERRARQFAGDGDGLKAVCSYGMPAFHNLHIDVCQRLALAPWLRLPPGTSVLDVGCGIGRWSVRMAKTGVRVVGVDHSPTMLEIARQRAERAGVAEHCRFEASPVQHLDLGQRFDRVLVVTVLQHIIDDAEHVEAIARLAAHVEMDGRLILLEAAPTQPRAALESAVFHARTEETYRQRLRQAGLHCEYVGGVDPSPLRPLYLPYYRRLPRPLALTGLAVVTAASLPIDVIAGRRLVRPSWHKVIVARHADAAATREEVR